MIGCFDCLVSKLYRPMQHIMVALVFVCSVLRWSGTTASLNFKNGADRQRHDDRRTDCCFKCTAALNRDGNLSNRAGAPQAPRRWSRPMIVTAVAVELPCWWCCCCCRSVAFNFVQRHTMRLLLTSVLVQAPPTTLTTQHTTTE